MGSPTTDKKQNASTSPMKQSVSLTSLPPPPSSSASTGHGDVGDLSIAAKLIIERPYNSLKKKRNSERDIWRNSWGSNHSQKSSCSLQSNFTSNYIGKDDFWLALQPNYNFIMDTKLLDTCREARGELEHSRREETNHAHNYQKLNGAKPNDEFIVDPKRLRCWLRHMQNELSKFPSISDAIKMKDFELMKLQKKILELYRIIESHARLVGACTRASSTTVRHQTNGLATSIAAAEQHSLTAIDQQLVTPIGTGTGDDDNCYSSLETQTTRRSHGSNSECNLKGLERRYHSLYLKAFEVKLLLENLLERKNDEDDSQNSASQSSSSEIDEGPAAKLARFTSELIAENNRRKTITNQTKKKQYEKSNANQSDEDEEEHYYPTYFDKTLTLTDSQANGFDADSEGSDYEIVVSNVNTNKNCETKNSMNSHVSSSADTNGNPMPPKTVTSTTTTTTAMTVTATTMTADEVKTASLPPSPVKASAALKRPHKAADTSKFNRSIRESDHLATYYFRHPDTEPESGTNNGTGGDCSSQDATSDVYSEDDQWFYTNGNDGNENADGNPAFVPNNAPHGIDEHNGNESRNFDLTCVSMRVNCSDVTITDEVDSPTTNGMNGSAAHISYGAAQKKSSYTLQCSKESIQQLVLGAETLILKTPPQQMYRRPSADLISSSNRKTTETKKKFVEQWLEKQAPQSKLHPPPMAPVVGTDGEASCEYTESDSAAPDSDGSDGLADSIATCLPGGVRSSSQCTSTEVIGGSADLLKDSSDNNCPSAKIVTRTKQRRNSDRPWSVSCLSQLTQKQPANGCLSVDNVNNQGLANHSISESALHQLNTSAPPTTDRIKGSDSKSSLKRRRMRLKKKQRSESGSNASEGSGGAASAHRRSSNSNSLLIKSESFSGRIYLTDSQTASSATTGGGASMPSDVESEENAQLAKPNFQLGAYTSNVFGLGMPALGALGTLAFYNGDEEKLPNATVREPSYTGTEDNSNQSEQQAWDDYQEKYMSEAYSEGMDSDAARKLLACDDYRNFLDSQSDCCSSLSAANNLDSMSPPRYRKQFGNQTLVPGANVATKSYRKGSFEDRRKLSTGAETTMSRASYKSLKTPKANLNRKLEMEFGKALASAERRRQKSNNDYKTISSSSSAASSDAENDSHIDLVLKRSRDHLENIQALKNRRDFLRPEDYAEIIATCRDNRRCLETVLHGPTGAVLSLRRHQHIRELLSSWESLLHWSENESVAKQLQAEMAVLVGKLHKIGTSCANLDTESAIHLAIEEAQNEKAQLYTHRSTMLRLNASVHSWLTRQELKNVERKQIQVTTTTTVLENSTAHDANGNAIVVDGRNGNGAGDSKTTTDVSVKEITTQGTDTNEFFVDDEFHKQLKNEVGNMYTVWEEADQRVKIRLESLTTSLIAWKQFESGLNEFQEALCKDKGTLEGLTGALEMESDAIANNLAHDVKEVAKRLSEKIDNHTSSIQQTSSAQTTNIKLNQIGALAFNLPSNGSLSDSGISDSGGSSDYGLSDRERRLGALRRLAKQLEQALVPGSAALNSITQRMEMAESELRSLQKTCRELIVRTAASQPTTNGTTNASENSSAAELAAVAAGALNQHPIPIINVKGKSQKRSAQNKRKPRRRTNSFSKIASNVQAQQSQQKQIDGHSAAALVVPSSEPDPDDPKDDSTIENDGSKRTWAWRLAKYAIPVQLAVVALLCAACLMEPHCCDGLNNYAWSMSPQLRYVRGPPPI